MKDKKLGFGIIGCGMIAGIHAKAIREINDAYLVAGFDPAAGRAEDFGKANGCAGYSDIDEFLANREIDVVTVATPSGLHLDGALKAIDAGKHVIVEKPIEITLERIDMIIKRAEEKGVILGGIFHSRYFPVPQLIKRAIEKGKFGRIALADAQVKWYRSQKYYDSGAWRGTWQLDGGGALMNQSIHAIDLLQWFLGPVTNITGRMTTLAHKRIEVEDTAAAVLSFENGAIGVIEGTTCAYPGFLKRIGICGSEGTAVIEEEELKVWEFKNPTKDDDFIKNKYVGRIGGDGGAGDPSSLGYIGHKLQLTDFVDCIKSGRKPLVDGAEARKSVEIIEAIYKSSREGTSVKLPLRG